MTRSVAILNGPSWDEVIKSLCTYGEGKHQVEFTIEGRTIKGAIYNAWDMAEFDKEANSHVYKAMFSWSPHDGQPDTGMSTVTYYPDTKKWGTLWQSPGTDF